MTDIRLLEELCVQSVPLVKIYRAGRGDYPMNNRGRWHHGLLFPISGSERYFFSSGVIDAPPGTLLYIPKGEAYRIELEDKESVVVCIDFELSSTAVAAPFVTHLTEKNNIKNLFYEANAVWQKNLPGRDATLKALIYQIIAALILQKSTRPSSEHVKKIAPAIDYLHAHYTEPDFSVEKLAKTAGMSRRYFEKLFFGEKRVTPRDYIIELKISLACELLLNEKLSVSDVAYELGYADVYHFSKLFKQKVGKTPSEYKRDIYERGIFS